jgi:hypothetical protein
VVKQFSTGERFDCRLWVELAAGRDQKRFDPVSLVGVEGVLELDSPNVGELRL